MPLYSHLHTEDNKERYQPHGVDVKVKFLMYVMRLEWCLTPRKHLANIAYDSKK